MRVLLVTKICFSLLPFLFPFSRGTAGLPNNNMNRKERSGSPESCVSMETEKSREAPIAFNEGNNCSNAETNDCKGSEVSSDPAAQHLQKDLDSIFQSVEKEIVCFVKNELKKFKKVLSSADSSLDNQEENEDMLDKDEVAYKRSTEEAFLKITLIFLRKIKANKLADSLQNKSPGACQYKFKSNLKERFQCLFEGIAKAGNPTPLNEIYTDLYVTEGETGGIIAEHEFREIETTKSSSSEKIIRCDEIFKPEKDRPTRTVMTKGVAGIGKTILTQKFALDWAEDKSNRNIQFTFPLTFRELNLLGGKTYSLVELIHHLFNATKEAGVYRFENYKIVFIFDGLDECRLPLDFNRNEIVTDITESTSVEVLLTNLIRGKLLPSALLWITTRPAAASQIPPEYVDIVTEVKGFNDLQKEEYFRKKIGDEVNANIIIAHIRRSQSLNAMCQIPVFCWITATVLQDVLKSRDGGELPKTMTEMYVHFLVVQTKLNNKKYHGTNETDPHWIPENKELIGSLGKLAFEQLQKGNLIFYESDLRTCGIDIISASIYSGVFTQIFKEEQGLYQDKVFCFVHLSVQEFLAALYVDLIFSNTGINPLEPEELPTQTSKPSSNKYLFFYQKAVDKALLSPNGQLDLFLRFLLGLSLDTNQKLLQGLRIQAQSDTKTTEETAEYVKEKIRENPSPEKSINLFHCLNELKDNSLVKEVQQYLNSGSLSSKPLSLSHWSALVFILLSSDEDLDQFDLQKYSPSEEALLRLLPVVKTSKKSLLRSCNLNEKSCVAVATILSSESTCLRQLDLSNNDLLDSGVRLLSAGLMNPNCKLEVLCLSGCLITCEGCLSLASALSSNPSHLRELDLSYNHPGDLGIKLLTDGVENPQWRLDTVRLDHVGAQWMKAGLQKYACELRLDLNTANKHVLLKENNTKAEVVSQELPYPDHPDRMDLLYGVLCTHGLTGRCYWEVERKGWLSIGVAYKGMERKQTNNESRCGRNDKSWALFSLDNQFSAWHNDEAKSFNAPDSPVPERVAVYLDWYSGTLSFYRVTAETLIHIHTFHTTFTEPVYPIFGFRAYSAMSLCHMSEKSLELQMVPSE
ncbi:NLR family CARD domain-containing protein 3-like isoform X2 [Fundulus heteroclitus]|uniref:NLR family CARD domain-containing protein 3-like isoform X2 n=1 Tax=Fundulus heteroclitus TaxID=8078 RepID=UPI00165ACEA2|nr:NLR family CARD domain-containing protein 3-like isoform X2 [Fundulus heteroclitus]